MSKLTKESLYKLNIVEKAVDAAKWPIMCLFVKSGKNVPIISCKRERLAYSSSWTISQHSRI